MSALNDIDKRTAKRKGHRFPLCKRFRVFEPFRTGENNGKQ